MPGSPGKFPQAFVLVRGHNPPCSGDCDPMAGVADFASGEPDSLRLSKSHFFDLTKHPIQSISARISGKFPNKAHIEPQLGSDNPLFDQKLLDILHEEGVRKKSGYLQRQAAREFRI